MRTLAVITFFVVVAAAAFAAQAPALLNAGQLAVQPCTFDVRTNGKDTAYNMGLALRRVNGQLRFLTLTDGKAHGGFLQEFAAPPCGGRVTSPLAEWNLEAVGAVLTLNFNGISYDQATDRLYVLSSVDYGESGTFYPTRIYSMTLEPNGRVSNVHHVSLEGIPSKQVFGTAVPLPPEIQAQLGCTGKPLAVGEGGYTSLVAQRSKASQGLTFFCLPDPYKYPDGAEIPAREFKQVTSAVGARGVRLTAPINYFDGGDPRQNPNTPPAGPPVAGAQYLSPRPDGLSWLTWGDSPWATMFLVNLPDVRGFVTIESVCKGKCWYGHATLNYDDRAYEAHVWDPANLALQPQAAVPSSMIELHLPRGNSRDWQGDIPAGNISGAAFDPVTRMAYLVGYPLGADDSMGRVFQLSLTGTDRVRTLPPNKSGIAPVPERGGTRAAVGPVPASGRGAPAGFVRCASEAGSCVFKGVADIAYGTVDGNGDWHGILKRGMKSPVACTNAAIGGDPFPNRGKDCYIGNQRAR